MAQSSNLNLSFHSKFCPSLLLKENQIISTHLPGVFFPLKDTGGLMNNCYLEEIVAFQQASVNFLSVMLKVNFLLKKGDWQGFWFGKCHCDCSKYPRKNKTLLITLQMGKQEFFSWKKVPLHHKKNLIKVGFLLCFIINLCYLFSTDTLTKLDRSSDYQNLKKKS